MFGSSGNRLAGLLWDGIDAAVEFSTLGEYRLPERGGVAERAELPIGPSVFSHQQSRITDRTACARRLPQAAGTRVAWRR